MESGVVASISRSETRITDGDDSNGGFTWQGKDPALQENFKSLAVSPEFGKTVGWKIKDGRDFNAAFLSDSSGFIINEAAVKYLGFKNPIGQTINWIGSGNYKIIGVVKDMISESAYQPVEQTFFYLGKGLRNVDIKISPTTSAHEAISKIGAIFKKFDPSSPFEYSFADDDYAKKFDTEERVGKLASCFAGLAIFISCLGLFGMASFTAEQRVKEIGIRKVLGATVFNLWQLLSKDFVALIVISLLIATPVSYYFMHKWLQGYQYRTEITWSVFVIAAVGAITLTLLTVSYQSIKAALANPVKSLKTE
jgi:ABC-type antimicrobial peptide transport system permease subunit